MKKMRRSIYHMAVLALTFSCADHPTVSVVVKSDATVQEQLAANELITHLSVIYPDYQFKINGRASKKIILAIDNKMDMQHEAYRMIASARSDTLLQIIGSNMQGVLSGTYDFLTSQGCMFLLSKTIFPEPKEDFILQDTIIANHALADKRIVFNWHNFLSGCTGWDFEQYKQWIDQSRRMKYNTIMIHAYGNNPMFRFSFNGETKNVGYIANTARGRDWGIAHLNDVRRMIGGELFEDSIFGASITKVPDEEHPEAAKQMMQKVFQYAKDNGMKICFALDLDTESANPQNIIATLPATDKFRVDNKYCPRPDMPEGYRYYKEQLKTLQKDYPQINMLTIWLRRGVESYWRKVEKKDLPKPWLEEFEKIEKNIPSVSGYRGSHVSDFALSKIVMTIEAICDEIGFDTELSIGSWDYTFIPSSDVIYPERIPFIALDYYARYDRPEVDDYFKNKKPERDIIPVIWAHHDDFSYMGRPYVPFANFSKINSARGVRDFGIIHWTTHPLDLYFRNISNQVWANSENENYRTTCNEFSEKTMPENKLFSEYIYRWHTEGPLFGRETSDRFVDEWVKIDPGIVDKCNERLALLKNLNTAELSPESMKIFNYFFNFEEFSKSFVINQLLLESVVKLINQDQIKDAFDIAVRLDPESSIKMYVDAIKSGQSTRGEEAIVVSLNLRWLPDFISVRQQLGLSPVLIKFQATQHEQVAQAAGTYTFWIDNIQNTWLARGEKETGFKAYSSRNATDMMGSYIEVDSTLVFRIVTVRDQDLLPGKFKLNILADDAPFDARIISNNQRVDFENENGEIRFSLREKGVTLVLYPVNRPVKLYGMRIEQIDFDDEDQRNSAKKR